jgi:hypothetical protein
MGREPPGLHFWKELLRMGFLNELGLSGGNVVGTTLLQSARLKFDGASK